MKKLQLIILLIFSLPGICLSWTLTEGGDHNGDDWVLTNGTEIAGHHYNIGNFTVPTHTDLFVKADRSISVYIFFLALKGRQHTSPGLQRNPGSKNTIYGETYFFEHS